MPWSGAPGSQTFSRTDGTRTGTTVWQQAQAASVDIDSPDHDTHDQDIATGLNSALKNDGGNSATANLPMGGFRHTNVGAAASRTDYARFADLQDGKGIYVPTVGGSADAITLTTGYSIGSYTAGQSFRFIAAGTNTGVAATVNVDGAGAISLTGPAGSTLSAGLIVQNAVVTIYYQSAANRFEVETVAPAAIPVGTIMAWPNSFTPSGWLECNGSAVSRTTYAALFASIGTSYGIGDGSTTFNLPDYRGYFLRGQDHGAGQDPDAASRTDRGDGTTGDNVGTKQLDQVKSHTHTASSDTQGAHTHPDSVVRFGDLSDVDGGSGSAPRIIATGQLQSAGSHSHTITVNNTGGNETRPKNVNVRWIILASPSSALATGTSVNLQTYGAIGDGNVANAAVNAAALTAALATGRSVVIPYTSAGYNFGTNSISVPVGGSIVGENQVTLLSQATGAFLSVAAFHTGTVPYNNISGLTINMLSSGASSTAIRLNTSAAVVSGVIIDNIVFENCVEAIGDSGSGNASEQIYISNVLCWVTRGRQIYLKNTAGFIFLDKVTVDYTQNGTAVASYDGVRFDGPAGLSLRRCVVQGSGAGSTQSFNNVNCFNIQGSGSSVWVSECLADTTVGNGFLFNNITDIYLSNVFANQNLGDQLDLTSCTQVYMSNTFTGGAHGITGAAASKQGLTVSSCTLVQAANTFATLCTGIGVSIPNSTNCTFSGLITKSNDGAQLTESGTSNHNTYIGLSAASPTFTGANTVYTLDTGVINAAVGSAAAPGIILGNDSTAGIYKPTTGWMAFAQGGNAVAGTPGTTKWTIFGGFALAFDPAGGTGDTGLSRTGAAALALGNGTAADASGSLSLAAVSASAAVKSSGATSGIGYATGAGGTTSQSTNKTTAWSTFNHTTGQITFAAGSLSAGATAASTMSNSAIAATDTVLFSHVSGGTVGAYHFNAAPGGGSMTIYITNISAGALNEQPVVNFTVLKGVTS